MKPDALVAGVDVAILCYIVAIQYCAAAAATVFHCTQFRFLKSNSNVLLCPTSFPYLVFHVCVPNLPLHLYNPPRIKMLTRVHLKQ